jgi:hypothetical protein
MPTAPRTARPEPETSLPRVVDDARFVAAAAARDRLAGEVARLEDELSNLQAVAAEQRQQRAATARRLVAGESLAAVRAGSQDGALLRIATDLRNARAALALAEAELTRATTVVAADLARQFFPRYREAVRRLAAAWLAFVRESHALAELDVQLDALHGRGGCECPVPRANTGDPATLDSVSSVVLRQLLDGGFLDPRADAEMLRGLAVRPKAL